MLEDEFYTVLIKNGHINRLLGKGGIYVNNIIQARISALMDIFPAVTACLSENYIRSIAKDYCKKYDSPQGNLNLYGDSFGQYLGELPECRPYPYIRDLTDFEYAIHCLLYAADENTISASEFLAHIAEQQNLLLSKASLGFMACYNITDIADFCLGKTSELPVTSKNFRYYFLYRDTETQKTFVKSITENQLEIIPILKTQGILGLNDRSIETPEIQEFINFLTIKNLWVK